MAAPNAARRVRIAGEAGSAGSILDATPWVVTAPSGPRRAGLHRGMRRSAGPPFTAGGRAGNLDPPSRAPATAARLAERIVRTGSPGQGPSWPRRLLVDSGVTVAAVILSATAEGSLTDTLGQPRVRRLVDVAWSGGALPIVVLSPDPDGAVAAALSGSEAIARLPRLPIGRTGRPDGPRSRARRGRGRRDLGGRCCGPGGWPGSAPRRSPR